MEQKFTNKLSINSFVFIAAIGSISTLPVFFVLQPADYIYGFAITSIVLSLAILLLLLKIQFEFTTNAIKLSFPPFVNGKTIDFEQIKNVQIENGSLLKYGGIGIRLFGNGTAYILGLDKNLVINLKNGKSIVISFHEQDEAQLIGVLAAKNIAYITL